MHLISLRQQLVQVAGLAFPFAVGESILTECSYKYTMWSFADLAFRSGLMVRKVWTDPQELFSLQYLEPAA